MKFSIISVILIVASIIIFKRVPEAEFMSVKVSNLEAFYENPQTEIEHLFNHYPAEDISEAQRWINKYNLGDSNTVQYIFKVADALRKFENQELAATENYGGRVFESIKGSKAQDILTDCGQFTDFVSLFMQAANIPFRRIDAHYIPDTAIGIHSFQEIFIKEKQQWAFLDITNDKILMEDAKGNFLTVQDVYERVKTKDFGNIGIYSFTQNNQEPIPWIENVVEETECFDPSIMLLYYTTNDYKIASQNPMLLRRHYFFYDWVRAFNNPKPTSDFWYFTRLISLYLGILFGIIALFTFALKLFKRKT